MLAFTVLVACSDPKLAPFKEGLAAYDEGRAALDGGDPARAVERFAAARATDPESVPLALWEAKALADAGQLGAADVRLSALVDAHGELGVAWYNRAAYRARAGRMGEAASDLTRALALGARSPLEAAADPDFEAARAHPAFAGVLPAQPLEATITGAESVFIGSRYPLVVTVTTLPNASPTLRRSGQDPGCLRLQRILQDDTAGAGKVTSVLTVELRAEAACDTALGPFEVRAGSATVNVDAVQVRIEAPEGHMPPPVPPLPAVLPFPATYAPADAGFRATRGDGAFVMGPPGAPIRATASGKDRRADVTLEWRVDGQTRAIGGWWFGGEPLAVSAGEWTQDVP